MKIGDRLRSSVEGQAWSGDVASILDVDGEPMDEVDQGTQSFCVVVRLDEPLDGCDWLSVGPFEPGQIGSATLH